jgi:signal transduction histidine kinase
VNESRASSSPTSELVRHVPELVLATAATVLIVLDIWLFEPGGPIVARTLAGATAGVSLAFLRRRPFAAYLVNGVAIYALIALGYPSDFYQWTNLIALFGAASRIDLRRAVVALVLGWAGVTFYFLRFPSEGSIILAGAVIAIWTAAWFAARAQYARVREIEVKRERDVTRADLIAQQARMELELERNRIARELHDIVGHAVNVMVVHAGAGRGAVDRDPVKARRALDTIAATGRAALADLDRMLDLLQGQPERSPLPGLDQLEDLCRAVDYSDLAVELSMIGDSARVSPSLGLAAYRIVQEGLTNVIKHAGATRAVVTVVIGDEMTIAISDDGRGASPAPGRGLVGIEDRASLHGGNVTYGRSESGGFLVRCHLPLESPA